MIKGYRTTAAALFAAVLLAGCSPVGAKQTNISIIYGITAFLALALLLCYCTFVKNKNRWFVMLFTAISVVNVGYFILSLSTTVEEALLANRIAYLGSVFLPLCILMMVANLSELKINKHFPALLVVLAVAMFFITASPGYLDIYYKSATLEVINGITVLVKEYGSWHRVYLFYLVFYWVGIITLTVMAFVKKKIHSTLQAVALIGVVSVNLFVWLIEQLVSINFEFLSISYVICELFLLAFVYIQNEHDKLNRQIEEARQNASALGETTDTEKTNRFQQLQQNLGRLTHTEQLIYNCYLEGKSTSEILLELNIKENTLKYHNKNIYSKLGVSSRKQLLQIVKEAQ